MYVRGRERAGGFVSVEWVLPRGASVDGGSPEISEELEEAGFPRIR